MRRDALLAALAVAALGCGRDPTQRNLEFVPEMIDSIAYDSFAPNPVTHDRKTLIAPVPGTIPRGFSPLRYGPGRAEAERAGRELESPVPASDASRSRGKQLYDTFCAVCHGRGGLGDGPVIPQFPMPPSLLTDRARRMPDGQMFHVISLGQGLMSSYAAQVRQQDRWKILHHVRALQAAGGKP